MNTAKCLVDNAGLSERDPLTTSQRTGFDISKWKEEDKR